MPAIAIGGAAREAKRLDDVLDKLNNAIKAYLSSLDPGTMTAADHRRVEEILVFAHNLEHAGDVVENNLMSLPVKRMMRGLALSEPDLAELMALFGRLTINLASQPPQGS